MKNKVLGIVAISENQALKVGTDIYGIKFGCFGWDTQTIDLSAADGVRTLQTLLESGDVAFCFALQGVGSRLTDGQNKSVWTKYRTPFLCLHHDNPSSNIYNHFCDSPYVSNIYLFKSYLDIQKRYVKSEQISSWLPYESGIMPHVTGQPFEKRPMGLVFVKNGKSPDVFAGHINQIKAPMRDAVWAGIDQLWKNENLVICDILVEAFTACGYDYKEFWAEFWGFAGLIENYLRAKRAATMVEWLKCRKDAVIIGDGWDFVDKTGTSATFKPGLPTEETLSIYSQSKFICNTLPYGSDIIHERITLGLCSNCAVISDSNAWWDENFSHTPPLRLIRWNQDLGDQLQNFIDNPGTAEKANSGIGWAHAKEKLFGTYSQIPTLLSHAEVVREFARKKIPA